MLSLILTMFCALDFIIVLFGTIAVTLFGVVTTGSLAMIFVGSILAIASLISALLLYEKGR